MKLNYKHIIANALLAVFIFFTASHRTNAQPQTEAKKIYFWETAVEGTESEIVIEIPTDTNMVIFQNLNPLQFHGYSGTLHAFIPKLSRSTTILADQSNIGSLLKSKKGNFIPLALPVSDAPDQERIDNFELFRTKIKESTYEIINIRSSGSTDQPFVVEAELILRDGEVGNYKQFRVSNIRLIRN